MSLNIENLIETLTSLGGLGVFLGTILEAIIAPIPSPLIPLAAGFLLIPSEASLMEAFFKSFILIALWGAFGATVGAFIPYTIAYFGGRLVIEKYGGYFGFSWEEVEKIQGKLERMKYDEAILFICRLAPVIPLSPISLLYGIIRFNTLKFTILTFSGALPRYFILAILGWYFKSAYALLAETFGFYETLITILIACIALLAFVMIRRRRSERKDC